MNSERYPHRQRPVHHAPIERPNEPVIVQVNVCTKDRRPVLACEAGHRLCRDVWQAADFWRVGRYVIMPDHIHLFCAPGRMPMPNLKQWVEYWKGQVAARWPGDADGIRTDGTEGTRTDGTRPPSGATPRPKGGEVLPPGNGNGGSGSVPTASVPRFKLWQRDCWDTQMRSREHYEEKRDYVRMNPVRNGLAATAEAWPYQGEVFSVGWM